MRRALRERWKPAPFPFGASYDVSDRGFVMRRDGRVLARTLSNHGYVVRLSMKGMSRTFRLNRLVARVFIEGLNDGDRVRFRDGNPLNPALSNLMVEPRFSKVPISRSERAPRASGRHHEKLTDDQVAEIRQRFLGGESRVALAAEFGISRGYVHKIGRGTARPG